MSQRIDRSAGVVEFVPDAGEVKEELSERIERLEIAMQSLTLAVGALSTIFGQLLQTLEKKP